MAKKQGSDDLYQLIHSLTPEEKGYFKKFAKRHSPGENNYLQLFDIISAQKSFEEASLKNKFRNYAVWKVYLFDMIMKCLMIYKNDLPEKVELIRQLIYIEILNQKGLATKSIQTIEKNLTTAREKEFFLLEHELLQRRFTQVRFMLKPRELETSMSEFSNDLGNSLRKQENYNRYNAENLKGFWVNRAVLHGQKDVPDLNKIVDIDFLKQRRNALTPGNERLRLAALSTYHTAYTGVYPDKCDFEAAREIGMERFKAEKKWLDTNHPIANFDSYVYALRSLLVTYHALDRSEEAAKMLDKEWRKFTGNEMREAEYLMYYVFEKFMCYWLNYKHKEGEAFSDKYMPLVFKSRYTDSYTNYLLDCLRFKILFEFANGNFQKAYFSIDEYEAQSIKKNYTRYYKEFAVLRTLIQIELGNFELAGNFIRNTVKREQKNLSSIEKQFLSVLKTMHGLNKKEVFGELLALLDNSKEKMLVANLVAKDWVQSHLKKKPIARGNAR